MFHGLKVSMAKGTNKKNIIKEDDSLAATQTTLVQWKVALKSLQDNIAQNEGAWYAVLGSYSALESLGSALYAPHDTDAFSCLTDLSNAKSRLESPPSGVEPHANATQRLENCKKELEELGTRISACLDLHTKRVETIRQFKYYDAKTRQMTEPRRKQSPSTKELERLGRNQKKSQEMSVEVANLTAQIREQMEQIELDKLASADRAISALILLQRQIFDANPVRDAVFKADKIGMGKRVPPRQEVRPWISERPYAPTVPQQQQPPVQQAAHMSGQFPPQPVPGQEPQSQMPGQQPVPQQVPMGIPGQPAPPSTSQPLYHPPVVPTSQPAPYSEGFGTSSIPYNYSTQSYESQPTAPPYQNDSFRNSGQYSSPPPPPPLATPVPLTSSVPPAPTPPAPPASAAATADS